MMRITSSRPLPELPLFWNYGGFLGIGIAIGPFFDTDTDFDDDVDFKTTHSGCPK